MAYKGGTGGYTTPIYSQKKKKNVIFRFRFEDKKLLFAKTLLLLLFRPFPLVRGIALQRLNIFILNSLYR